MAQGEKSRAWPTILRQPRPWPLAVFPCSLRLALLPLDLTLSLSNLDLPAELSARPTLTPPEKSDDTRLDDVFVFSALIEGRRTLADPRWPVNDMGPIWPLPAFPMMVGWGQAPGSRLNSSSGPRRIQGQLGIRPAFDLILNPRLHCGSIQAASASQRKPYTIGAGAGNAGR